MKFRFFPNHYGLIARALWQRLAQQRLDESAKVLVFTTLITLVPMLAVAFALLRGFGFSQVLEPWLYGLFKPMGDEGRAIVHYLLQFVAQTDVQSLGAFGVVFLLFSVQRLREQLSQILDRLWQMPEQKLSFTHLISTIGFIVLFPLLLAVLMQMRETLQVYGHWLAQGLSLLGLWAFISALYYYLPQARVQLLPALGGAAFFMLCWVPLSALFAVFMRYSSSYSIIYSSFAALIVLLLWLQSIWLLFLLGAQLGVFLQYPQYLRQNQSALRTEQLAYDLMALIEQAFSTGKSALSAQQLSEQTQAPLSLVNTILHQLVHAELLNALSEHRYQLAFAPEHYPLSRIDEALYPSTPPQANWWHQHNESFYQQPLQRYRQRRFPESVV